MIDADEARALGCEVADVDALDDATPTYAPDAIVPRRPRIRRAFFGNLRVVEGVAEEIAS